MRAEKVVAALLGASSAVAAIVGQKIFHVAAHDDTDAPLVVYRKLAAQREAQIDANTGADAMLVTATVEIFCVAKSGAQLLALGEAVRTALSYQAGTVAGVALVDIQAPEEGAQEYEPTLREFSQSWTFSMQHTE